MPRASLKHDGRLAATVGIAEKTVRDVYTRIGEMSVINEPHVCVKIFCEKAQVFDWDDRRGTIKWNHPVLSAGALCSGAALCSSEHTTSSSFPARQRNR
jgi:hypothetical protein